MNCSWEFPTSNPHTSYLKPTYSQPDPLIVDIWQWLPILTFQPHLIKKKVSSSCETDFGDPKFEKPSEFQLNGRKCSDSYAICRDIVASSLQICSFHNVRLILSANGEGKDSAFSVKTQPVNFFLFCCFILSFGQECSSLIQCFSIHHCARVRKIPEKFVHSETLLRTPKLFRFLPRINITTSAFWYLQCLSGWKSMHKTQFWRLLITVVFS